MFGMPKKGEIDYSVDIDLDLATVQPSVSGPKRPQDRINLAELGQAFRGLFVKPVAEGGDGQSEELLSKGTMVSVNGSQPAGAAPQVGKSGEVGHGSVLIAAITSCTNTSNPSVMLGAGLLAKKAVEKGLTVNPTVKTSMAPGSRVVTDYLAKTGLQPYLNQLGFNIVGYGCTTCIGNSGPLPAEIAAVINEKELVAVSVLSGNRTFEGLINSDVRANYLMSPPLVVAYALAGRIDMDITRESLGKGKDGKPVY